MNFDLWAQISPELQEAVRAEIRTRVKEASDFSDQTYSYVAKRGYRNGFRHGSLVAGVLGFLAASWLLS